jgi:sulfite reductase alpha subunit-like flavoprotein
VRKNIEDVWQVILSMKNDPDELVRDQVVHNLCDGSPADMQEQVVEVLEEMYNDQSERVRKKARKALTSWRHTGKLNVL